MGQVISEALMNLLSVQNLIFVNVGIFIGIIFGAIPGMNGNLAITVFDVGYTSIEPVQLRSYLEFPKSLRHDGAPYNMPGG